MTVSSVQVLASFGLLLVAWIASRFLSRRSRWSISHIPGPKSASLLIGNLPQMFGKDAWVFHQHLSETYGSISKIRGLFGEEQLYVSDPLALHHVVLKDKQIFEATDTFLDLNTLMFGPSLLSSEGDEHRKMRKLLNSSFSQRHMRGLAPMFYPIAHMLRDIITRKVTRKIDGDETKKEQKDEDGEDGDWDENGARELNVITWISRAALEYIGQGGMGYSFEALDESKTSEYNDAVAELFPVVFSDEFLRQLIPYAVKLGPPAFRRILAEIAPLRVVQRTREIVDVLVAHSERIYASKKQTLSRGDEALLEEIAQGKDITSVLLRANAEANTEDRLTDKEVLGHMNSLIFAGHDTTTTAVSHALHQLSMHPEVQSRLRKEVRAARSAAAESGDGSGDLEYDELMALPYLDAVCRETLRVYPPITTMFRRATQDVVLPLMFPIRSKDGDEIREIALPRNTEVLISILGANRSKGIWGPDASEWKPERWLQALPATVSKAHLPGVYSSMMTFLGGSRACIGFKFAELEMKLVLSVLLEKLEFAPSGKEIHWNITGIQTPGVAGQKDFKPRLPLRVSVASAEAT